MKVSIFRISKSIVNSNTFDEYIKYSRSISLALVNPISDPNSLQQVHIVNESLFITKICDVLPIQVKKKHLNLNRRFSIRVSGGFYEIYSDNNPELNYVTPLNYDDEFGENQYKYSRVYRYQKYVDGELKMECICESNEKIIQKSEMEGEFIAVKKIYRNVEQIISGNNYTIYIRIVS